MQEIITSGKTVEEAIESALAQLGLSEDEVTIDIIQLPQKKLFKSIPAKIKVSVDASINAPQGSGTVQKAETKSQKAENVKAAQAPQKAQSESAPQKATKAQEPAKENGQANKEDLFAFQQEEVDINSSEHLKNAKEYLTDICEKMGASGLEFSAATRGEGYIVKISGEKAGFLIGYRGETMDALGYLTSLYVNRFGGDYVRINIDINDYRAKREDILIALAQKVGAKVLQTKRSKTLEPMNPYERRILHSVIMEIDGIKSESVGEGAQRRVCVMLEGDSVKWQDKPRRNNQKGRFNKNYNSERKTQTPERNFASKKQSEGGAPTAQKRTQTINDSESLPLYGKIEL